MLRKDVFEIARYANEKGFRVVLATCGTMLTDERVGKLIASGVKRISISIDGATSKTHDKFRGTKGAFDDALKGIEAIRKAGLEFQINTTVTSLNVGEIDDILDLAIKVGAKALDIFLLVPTGRGKELLGQEIPPDQYEKVLKWIIEKRNSVPIHIKPTCAPHFSRIIRQLKYRLQGEEGYIGGCLGGKSFCFISHIGDVQICGFMEVNCGNILHQGFQDIWKNSPVFKAIRDIDSYKGKCGVCEFRYVCGGCRARAYGVYQDYLAEEPYCVYQPQVPKKLVGE
jgi:radical SAM protein with 4Fe4S-binding SPASM domain